MPGSTAAKDATGRLNGGKSIKSLAKIVVEELSQFALISAACAYAASKIAVRQGKNPAVWAGITFFLPAVLLILMKLQVEHDKGSD